MARTAEQDKVRELQRTLYRAAKADPGRRFHALSDKVHRRDVLERAWERNHRRATTKPAVASGSRMPAVKNVGEPCAGEPHARFDGGREETSISRPCRATPGASRLPDQPLFVSGSVVELCHAARLEVLSLWPKRPFHIVCLCRVGASGHPGLSESELSKVLSHSPFASDQVESRLHSSRTPTTFDAPSITAT